MLFTTYIQSNPIQSINILYYIELVNYAPTEALLSPVAGCIGRSQGARALPPTFTNGWARGGAP